MEHTNESEVTYHHEPADSTKRIWRVFWLLLGITVVELALGLMLHIVHFPDWLAMFVKGVIVILTLFKAFYIVSVFMHLGDEIRNMIMTVAVPLMLFIWFISAFLWDGSSYRTLRNRYEHNMDKNSKQGEGIITREIRSNDTATHPLD